MHLDSTMDMMKRIFIFVLLTGFIVSCKKETSTGFVLNNNLQINDTTWSNSTSIQSLAKDITADIKLTEFLDTVMLTNVGIDDDDKIFNNDNFRVAIPKNSLVNTITNKTFSKGTVKIKLQASTSTGSFIRNFCSCTYNGHQGQSVGFFNISIYNKDTLMSVKSGSSIHLLIKDSLIKPQPQSVMVYSGNGYNVTDDNFAWQVDNYSSQHLDFWFPQGSSPRGYDVTLNKLGWISLTAVDNTPINNNKINVYLPVNFTNKNTLVYVVHNNSKNIARLDADFPSRTFSHTNITSNQNVSLVTISKIDNQYYLGYKTVNYTTQQTIFKVDPQPVTIANVIDYLNTL